MEEILVKQDPVTLEHVTYGVRMADKDKTCVLAPRVVSGAGFARTFNNLLNQEVVLLISIAI